MAILSPGRKRLIRFGIAGLLNSVFGFAIYGFALVLGVPLWLALLFGLLAGIVFNFITTGGYVFRDLSAKRIPRFVAAYAIVYLANLILIWTIIHWLTDRIMAQAVITAPLAVLSYVLMSRFVFVEERTVNARGSTSEFEP